VEGRPKIFYWFIVREICGYGSNGFRGSETPLIFS